MRFTRAPLGTILDKLLQYNIYKNGRGTSAKYKQTQFQLLMLTLFLSSSQQVWWLNNTGLTQTIWIKSIVVQYSSGHLFFLSVIFQVHLGQGVWVCGEVWRRICTTHKDSLFVKELAVAVWGTAALKERSISGKECPTKRGEARPPLSPGKFRAVKGT